MIIVVGGGYAGAATARALARGGADGKVVLLEAEAVAGRHASDRNAGLAVPVLEEDPPTMDLAARGARLLAEELARDPRAYRRGGAVLLLPDEAEARRLSARAEACGVELEILPAREAAVRMGALEGAASKLAAVCPSAAQVYPERLLAHLLDGAVAAGARLMRGARATGLMVQGGRVRGVRTTGGRLDADWVVDAAGAWAGTLRGIPGGERGVDPGFAAYRRHLFVSAPSDRIDPGWPFVWDVARDVYVRFDGNSLTLCPCDEDPHPPEAPAVDPEAAPAALRRIASALPALSGIRIDASRACLRTFASDRRYVVGPDPLLEGLFWVAGLGGTGATSALALGEAAADLLAGRARPMSAFDPARFVVPGER